MAVVRIKSTPLGWEAILEGPGVSRFTKTICQEIIETAREIFESQAKHTHAPTIPEYADAFEIRRRGKSGRFSVVNTDPAANLVEFGAHPGGGTTQTLRYRPLGRAVETLRR